MIVYTCIDYDHWIFSKIVTSVLHFLLNLSAKMFWTRSCNKIVESALTKIDIPGRKIFKAQLEKGRSMQTQSTGNYMDHQSLIEKKRQVKISKLIRKAKQFILHGNRMYRHTHRIVFKQKAELQISLLCYENGKYMYLIIVCRLSSFVAKNLEGTIRPYTARLL